MSDAIIRNGNLGVEDFTELMGLYPRAENALERMNLFTVDYLTTDTANLERYEYGTDEMYSVARGADRQVAGDDGARRAKTEVPFFTLDKQIKPSDLFAMRELGTDNEPKNGPRALEKLVERIQRGHARTHVNAMYSCLDGKVYAVRKDGTEDPSLAITYQAMWGIPDADMYQGNAGGAVTFNLGTPSSEAKAEFEKFRAHVVARAGDNGDNYDIIMLMGHQAMNWLVAHPDYADAANTAYQGRDRAFDRVGGTSNGRFLELDNITFMEDTSGKIATDQGRIFVRGIADMFVQYYAPADTVAAAGDEAEEGYIFVEQDRRRIKLESELGLGCYNTRPELVGKYTFNAA